MNTKKKVTKYRVNYIESEAGWTFDGWHVDYDTKEIAMKHWQLSQPKPLSCNIHSITAFGNIEEVEVEEDA